MSLLQSHKSLGKDLKNCNEIAAFQEHPTFWVKIPNRQGNGVKKIMIVGLVLLQLATGLLHSLKYFFGTQLPSLQLLWFLMQLEQKHTVKKILQDAQKCKPFAYFL